MVSPLDSIPPPVFTIEAPSAEPRKRLNMFLNKRGFPNQSHKFDVLLHNIQGGLILRKHKHKVPPNDEINP